MVSIAWSGTQFTAVSNNQYFVLTSPDGITWTQHAIAFGAVFMDIAYGNGKFVAVDNGGGIRTSPDGITWTAQTSGTTMWLNGVAWSGTKFVAVGNSAAITGTVLTSPDGITWTPQFLGVLQNLTKIVWGGTQFVAVGWGGGVLLTSPILTSPDGITWTQRASGTTNPLNGIAWSGTQFAVVGGDFLTGTTATILTSPNGIAWTQRGSGTLAALRGVAWNGAQFIAVGDVGNILSSPDGVTWVQRVSGTTLPLYSVVWSGTQFVAVSSGGGILTSPDGITWAVRASGFGLMSIAWNGMQFVAVGQGGTILTSLDGITWAARVSGTTAQWLQSVVWNGSQFAVVGTGGTILTSPDGTTWTVRVSGSFQPLTGIAWNGSRFVAVGNLGTILTSPDGVAWAGQLPPTPSGLTGVIWAGTQFVAATAAANTILTSPDGLAWTARVLPVGGSNFINGFVWNGSHLVAVGLNGIILTSGSASGLALNAKEVPLGDVNGNLMPEVAALYHEAAGTHAIYIKDGLSGALIRKIVLGAAWTPLDLQVLPDINANGKPELAVLLRNATTGAVLAQIVDSFTGLLIRNVAFTGNPWTPLALQVVPDVNANGQPELAVLLRNATTGAVQVQVKDTLTGLLVRNVAYTGNPLTPLALQVVPDLNANAKPELAVLQRNATTGAVQAQVMDAFTGLLVKTVLFTAWTPLDMQVVPDLNANAKSELAVLLRNPANGAVIGQVTDAFTGLLVKNVAFTGWAPLALRVAPDINANGKSELAVLMRNPANGAVLVQVSDAFSGLLVKNVAYGAAFSPRDLAVLPDTNANGKPDLAVLGANSATEAARVQIHDSLTGALLRNIAVP